MNIGLIDVDGHNFPNLSLMKLSAYHKSIGDCVEWYDPFSSLVPYDRVYMSKVFSFTPDYEFAVNTKELIKGGTGYAWNENSEHEQFCAEKYKSLSSEIEHIYPDYALYGITDTAYGFLTRGCPRNCDFCIVGKKEGFVSRKVADLSEFWNGQENIKLLDPNILACKDCKDLLGQLIRSKAKIDFTQGLDIRLMDSDKANLLKQIKTAMLHFAWDRYEDKEKIVPKFEEFKSLTGIKHRKLGVYVLTNKDTTFEQDLDRVMTLRNMSTEEDEIGYNPYVMIYEKYKLPRGHILNRLAMWTNGKIFWHRYSNFEDFQRGEYKTFIEWRK